MEAAEAPKIVLEQPAPCSDAPKAEESLRRALAPSLAPRPAWTVSLRFARAGSRLAVEGEITDEVGAPVAHRSLVQQSGECSSLARAAGVWASLVLDAEVERATKIASSPPPDAAALSPVPSVASAAASFGAAPGPSESEPGEKPYVEAPTFLIHPKGERTIELGATSFLMGGAGGGIVVGPSIFGVFEVGHGWYLRPTVAVGASLDPVPAGGTTTWGGTRWDACGRVPGLYLERRGMQFDMCGGADVGFLMVGSGAPRPFLAVGPSVGLRGELGSALSAMVRAVGEVNIVREDQSGVFAGRAEVGLSWRLR